MFDLFDKMDNGYILIKTGDYFTKIYKYFCMAGKIELKESEIIFLNLGPICFLKNSETLKN